MKTYFYDSKEIRWRLPSRERLFHRLGEYDTMAEFTVLSERYFERLCNDAESYVEFVNAKAIEYDVKIRAGVSLDNYREALYKSFMVNSTAMFDDFVENFKEDMKIFVDHSFSLYDSSSLSKYERLKKSMENAGYNLKIPKWLHDIVIYYRLIRNHVAHNQGDEEKCLKMFEKIDFKQMCKDYPVFINKSPNPPGKITMDDFYLFSASIKHIANLFTISIQGKENWFDIGKYHPSLQRSRIPSGKDRRKLVCKIINELGVRCEKDLVDGILENVRQQYNLDTTPTT